ncbi:MAG: hypothetical protein QM820_59430 [Minicystis sp.]
MFRSTLASALLLAAASCSEVLVPPGATGATASGAGGGTASSSTGATGGVGGSNTGGTGGATPVDLPWQTTAAGDVSSVLVASDPSGNAIVAGLFGGTLDLGGVTLTSAQWGGMFVAKLDHAGHYLWARSFDNVRLDIGLAVDGLGNILLTGDFREVTDFGGGPLTSAGHADIFVTKLDPQGNHVYSRAFGDTTSEQGGAVAADAAGNAYVTGTFRGTIDFGGGPLTSPDGDGDVFVTKLESFGKAPVEPALR